MTDLRALLRSLAGPLELEARKGYPDAAVMGQSIGEYARGWARRAVEALGDSDGRTIAEIANALEGYDGCDADGRRKRVEQARELLAKLGADGVPAAGEPSGTKAGSAPRVRQRPPAPRPTRARAKEVPFLDQPFAEGRLANASWPKRLAQLGIRTKRDLLYHVPRDYAPVRKVAELVDGERAVVVVTAGVREESVASERRGHRLMRYLLWVTDETGKAFVTSFAKVPRRGPRAQAVLNSPLTLKYEEGARLLVDGTVRRAGSLIEILYTGAERVAQDDAPPAGALAPIYPLTEGVFQGQVRPVVRRLLAGLPSDLPDPLPDELRKRHDLIGLGEALRQIHWPQSPCQQGAAQRRLAFEELLTLQLALAQRKSEMKRPGVGISMKPRGDPVAALEEILPFSLTRAQQRAISEIAADMAADVPMSRLVQGDVGSGKTVVAAAALLIALQNGYQGALMAPTELLADQHYLVLSHMLRPLGAQVELLTGSLRSRERERAYARIGDGRAQVVVGTHALIQQGVEFHRLGLVIADEQHRFGVRQRTDLRLKGLEPDMLVMTATPIPRSLALTLYGDLDMSVLDEMPPGRAAVRTRWLPIQQLDEAYRLVRSQVSAGHQVYVICPLVEESEALQAEAATKLAEQLQREVFPELKVGLLHGAMPVAEKDAAMESFRNGATSVLCATTVVEVGVDVPNATLMLILNAERFGLAQLHQLRGRIGRGGHESHCVLITDRKYHPLGRIAPALEELSEARSRLQVLLETADGFTIAERDLLLRGPGEFYGTRQHGLPDFRLARLTRDVRVMEEAREAAAWLIEQDPRLQRPGHRALRSQVAAIRARMDQASG
ncbi:MAG: ATP-dependent DNA helicase RecG [Armatimonadota bacterium]